MMTTDKLREALKAGAFVYLPKNSYPASIAGKGISARVNPQIVRQLLRRGEAMVADDTWERTTVKGVSQ